MSKSKFGTAKIKIGEQPVTDFMNGGEPPDGFSGIKKIVEATSALEEKTMNFKWRFDFVIPTGIMQETVTIEVCTEIDSERVAFGLALNKIISTEKYKSSTGVPRYTQKFTKEKITQE